MCAQCTSAIKSVKDLIRSRVPLDDAVSAERGPVVADGPDEDVLDLDDGGIVRELLLDARHVQAAGSPLHEDSEHLDEERFRRPQGDEGKHEGAGGVRDVVVAVRIAIDTAPAPDDTGRDDDADRLEAVTERVDSSAADVHVCIFAEEGIREGR